VCRTIEGNLADPDLGLTSIAKEERVSPRYLQKLFEAVGQDFSIYLRSRRLERCRAELVNPLYEKVSIADVCFRWAFNDPAYFSRVFREQYGASPRTFRHEAGLELARHLVRRISRGVPVNALQSRSKPVLEVNSGDTVTIETLTQHAADDWERMVQGDPGAESVFHWTAGRKNVNRRGAGPMDASIYGRGAGEGIGVHICTGPIAVRGADLGDVLEVRIVDIHPRSCANPKFAGRAFGSNDAA
jgi:AraC-like DNA-binding protein